MPDIRVAGIMDESIVDGPGLRFTVFVQGCTTNCPGCQNPQTHALDGGELMRTEDILARFLADPLLSGITFSGGEPFLQPEPLLWLARRVHEAGRDVMSYSGFTYEALLERGLQDPATDMLLRELDALVDGPYVEGLRDLDLEFRGSSNQRYLRRNDLVRLRAEWEDARKGANGESPRQ